MADQTATVVGPAGEEIYTDKYGRVKVQFHEGDPDKPIIVGRVYNAAQMPPYDLPGGGNMMGFKEWEHNTSFRDATIEELINGGYIKKVP